MRARNVCIYVFVVICDGKLCVFFRSHGGIVKVVEAFNALLAAFLPLGQWQQMMLHLDDVRGES